MKLITITINHEGDQTVETAGYNGVGCDAVHAVFDRAVGTVEKVTFKAEHNKPAVHKNMLRQ